MKTRRIRRKPLRLLLLLLLIVVAAAIVLSLPVHDNFRRSVRSCQALQKEVSSLHLAVPDEELLPGAATYELLLDGRSLLSKASGYSIEGLCPLENATLRFILSGHTDDEAASLSGTETETYQDVPIYITENQWDALCVWNLSFRCGDSVYTLSLYDETGLSADAQAEYRQQLFTICHDIIDRLPASS